MKLIEKFQEIENEFMDDWLDYFNIIKLPLVIFFIILAIILTPVREKWRCKIK